MIELICDRHPQEAANDEEQQVVVAAAAAIVQRAREDAMKFRNRYLVGEIVCSLGTMRVS